MAAYDKLDKFLRRCFYGIHANKCEKLRLMQLPHSGQGQTVAEWLTPSSQQEESRLPELANEIMEAASADAEGLSNVQRYALLAFFMGQTKHGARLTMRLDGGAEGTEDNEWNDGGDTEPAGAKGLIAQLSRHNEQYAKQLVVLSTAGMVEMRRLNSQLAQMVSAANQDRIRLIEAYENLTNEAHDRDLKRAQAAIDTRMKTELFDKLGVLLPMVVNKMAGKDVLPTATTPQMAALRGLAESFTSEQMQALFQAGILTADQLMALHSLLDQMKKQDEAEEKRKLLAQAEYERAKNSLKLLPGTRDLQDKTKEVG